MSNRPSSPTNPRPARGAVTAAALALFFSVQASAVPIPIGNTLSFIADGASNTILFTENTVLSLCVDGVTLPTSVHDGSSNTILFGESSSLTVTGGFVGGRRPVTEITDGTSNTIVIGETGFCLGNVRPVAPGSIVDGASNTITLPEGAAIDVCASNVRPQTAIGDGSSNTIQFGETVPRSCYTGIRVDGAREQVPEPDTWLLFLLGVAAVGFSALRRKRDRRD
jgi:PEP-CTERM motif-containing protein